MERRLFAIACEKKSNVFKSCSKWKYKKAWYKWKCESTNFGNVRCSGYDMRLSCSPHMVATVVPLKWQTWMMTWCVILNSLHDKNVTKVDHKRTRYHGVSHSVLGSHEPMHKKCSARLSDSPPIVTSAFISRGARRHISVSVNQWTRGWSIVKISQNGTPLKMWKEKFIGRLGR